MLIQVIKMQIICYIVIFALNFSYVDLPIPLTFIISSILLNRPLFCLYVIIASALLLPIPDKVVSSFILAVLILISLVSLLVIFLLLLSIILSFP